MRRILYAVIFLLLFASCATGPRASVRPDDVWADAGLVAEQRLEIERLKHDLERMGDTFAEFSNGIDRITDGLTSGIGRSQSLEELFSTIDEFVRELITENNKLRELQRADSGEDAGS